MSRFTGPLAVTFLSVRSGLASLDQPLIWEVGEEGSGIEVALPRGFVSDGITAPRTVWWLIPPWGHRGTRAAMLHDYALSRLKAGRPHPNLTARSAIDREFRLALKACGVSPALANAMWMAVRLWAGWRAVFPKSGYMNWREP